MKNFLQKIKNQKIINFNISAILGVLALQLVVISSCVSMKIDRSLELANNMALDGLYKEAIYQYESILKDYPDAPIVHRNLAIVLVRIGLYNKAFNHLKVAHKHFSKEFQTNFYLAETFRLFKDWNKAIEHYKNALKAKNNNYRAARGLAWTYYYNGQYRKGLEVLNNIDESKQMDPQINIIKARLNIKLRNFGAAFALMQRQRTLGKKNKVFLPYVLSIIGDIYFERERLDKAMSFYKEALVLRPHLSSALIGQGKILYLDNEFEKAAKLMTRAYTVNPDLSEPYYYLAKIYENSNPKKSLNYYQQFAKIAQYDLNYNFLLADIQDNIDYLQSHIQNLKDKSKNITPKTARNYSRSRLKRSASAKTQRPTDMNSNANAKTKNPGTNNSNQ